GGIIEFDPHVTYQNNTVYYWRIGVPVMGGEMKWNTSSFMYESDRNGFGQAHYYQFADNQFTDIKYEEGRKLSFNERSTSFNIHTGVYPYANVTSNFSLNYGNSFQAGLYSPFAVNSNCLRFYVIDGKTLVPWVNQVSGTT